MRMIITVTAAAVVYAVTICPVARAAPVTCTQTATKLCPGAPLTVNPITGMKQDTVLILAETFAGFLVGYPDLGIQYQPGVIQLSEPGVPSPPDSDFVTITCNAAGVLCKAKLESDPSEPGQPVETSMGDAVGIPLPGETQDQANRRQFLQDELAALLAAPTGSSIKIAEEGIPEILELNLYDAIGPGGMVSYAIFSDVAIPEPSSLATLLGCLALVWSRRSGKHRLGAR